MSAILEIQSLRKYYGKSTLLNCIATVIQPTSGKIILNGKELQSLKGSVLADYR